MRHLKKLIILLCCCSGLFLLYFYSQNNNKNEEFTNVYVENNLIYYDGSLSEEANDKVKNLYNENITGLAINSRGGEINLGMDLGDWIYKHDLDIYVKNYAFSSAANYVVPAGKNIFLYKNSMIGWHGGVNQVPTTLFEKFMTNFILKNYIKEAKIKENKFFKKIKVNQDITTYGKKKEFNKYNEKDYIGWTYSLNMMKSFGMKNIILIDKVWNPPMEFNGNKIFLITK